MTPGASLAALVSTFVILPWATPERTNAAWSIPGSETSSVYVPLP
jgi:hypothetical protein